MEKIPKRVELPPLRCWRNTCACREKRQMFGVLSGVNVSARHDSTRIHTTFQRRSALTVPTTGARG